MTPDCALAACRFLHVAAATALWGAFAYLSALVPAGLSHPVAARLSPARLVAIALVVFTGVAALPIQTAMIGDGWRDALDPEILPNVVSETGAGKAWLIQAVASLLLLPALIAPSPLRPLLTALAAGLVLVSLASGGHAVMEGGWTGVGHQVGDAVHVLSAGAWVGALLPLLIIVSMLKRPSSQPQVMTSLIRFSRAGYVAVALAICSGIANSFFIVGWPTNWSTLYRKMLLAKIGVVITMMVIATINRFWFVRQISRSAGSADRGIRLGIIAEIALGLSAILLVSVFGMLDPN